MKQVKATKTLTSPTQAIASKPNAAKHKQSPWLNKTPMRLNMIIQDANSMGAAKKNMLVVDTSIYTSGRHTANDEPEPSHRIKAELQRNTTELSRRQESYICK